MAPSQFAHDVVSIVEEVADLDWMVSTWANRDDVECNETFSTTRMARAGREKERERREIDPSRKPTLEGWIR